MGDTMGAFMRVKLILDYDLIIRRIDRGGTSAFHIRSGYHAHGNIIHPLLMMGAVPLCVIQTTILTQRRQFYTPIYNDLDL